MVDGAAVTTRAALLRYSVFFVLSVLSSIAIAIATWHMTDQEYFSLGYIERYRKLVALAPHWYVAIQVMMHTWSGGEFITMLFNKKRRAVHDFIAGTVVVTSRKSSNPPDSSR